MLAAFAGLLGCGDARQLDPSGQGGQGAASGQAGQGTASGQGGQAGQAGAGTVIVDPPAPGVPITPTATECGCAPGAGIDLLACGSDWLPNTLRDAPEAVITPDGGTIIYNRCFANGAGGCASAMFRWKAGEGRSLLARGAWAFAVSADGARALGTYAGGDAPFIADADGTVEGLPLGKSYAHLLTAAGDTVVARVELSPSLTQAARWSVPDGLRTLGDLVGGPDFSEPTAINADASVVVGYGNTTAGQEPFLWTRAGGMVGLPTLPSRTVQTVARATSADGSVIVGSNLTDSGTAIVRWASGAVTSLGALYGNVPAGGPTSYFSWWSPPLLVSTTAPSSRARPRRRRTRRRRSRSGGPRRAASKRCRPRRRASCARSARTAAASRAARWRQGRRSECHSRRCRTRRFCTRPASGHGRSRMCWQRSSSTA